MKQQSHMMRRALFMIAFAGLTLGIVLYWKNLIGLWSTIQRICRPIIIAIVISFFVNLPMYRFEQLLQIIFRKSKMKHKEGFCRTLGMIFAFLLMIGIITFVFYMLLPQLKESIKVLISNLGSYKDTIVAFACEYFPDWELDTLINDKYAELIKNIPTLVSDNIPKLFTFTAQATSTIADVVIAIFMSFYLLISKEKLFRQGKTLIKTYLPKRADKILEICSLLAQKFRKFLGGQLIEALILGALTFIGMTVLRLPYSPLVSTLVCVTAVIPIFGAFIGIIVSALLILMVNPTQAIIFTVFLIVLQQIEGNVIYPRVVGDSIGLSGLWVLVAVVVGGGLFGIPGIFVGIPIMSAVYELLRRDVRRKEEHKSSSEENEEHEE